MEIFRKKLSLQTHRDAFRVGSWKNQPLGRFIWFFMNNKRLGTRVYLPRVESLMGIAGSCVWEIRPKRWCPPTDSRRRCGPWFHLRHLQHRLLVLRPCRWIRLSRQCRRSAARRPAADGVDASGQPATDVWPPPGCRWRSDAPARSPRGKTSANYLCCPSSPRSLEQ